MKRPDRALAALVLLLAIACRDIDTTADGTPIVSPERDAVPTDSWVSGDVRLRFEIDVWTNRMPGPETPRGDSGGGYPLHAAVRVHAETQQGGQAEIRIPALTLWSATGDSLLAAFALTLPDGAPPVLFAGPGQTTWELMDDRARPRRAAVRPDAPCRPVLRLESGGKSVSLSLPETGVTAVY